MKHIATNLIRTLAFVSALHFQLSALAQGTGYSLLTITNPTPAAVDNFARSLAAIGTDRILIGAYRDDTGATNAGAAYLYRGNGELLLTITNPTPASGDNFGQSVTAVGADCLLIGAPHDDAGAESSGAAYLFNLNGGLLRTFTNPAPAIGESFGIEVAAMGNNRVLISAPNDDTGETNAGVVYLFNTNGALLTTFTNPAPSLTTDSFGISIAAVSHDKLIVGAPLEDRGALDAGVAYLFTTNGALLVTFTNPAPTAQDNFGFSVAAVGNDRVLIGAFGDDTGALDTGSAYLFRTNGTLLVTYTNPAPASSDSFGISVAAGAGGVLIGAHQDDIGATNAGAVYLFNTNGLLLTTFTNPTPEVGDNFGISVAGLGEDRVLIGAHQDDAGETNAGAAYLFTPALPGLAIKRTGSNAVTVSWPSPSTGFMLQQNSNGVSSAGWSNLTSGIFDDGTNKILIVNPPAGDRFYRLFKP